MGGHGLPGVVCRAGTAPHVPGPYFIALDGGIHRICNWCGEPLPVDEDDPEVERLRAARKEVTER